MWFMPVIPALGKLRSEDGCPFRVSLGYTVIHASLNYTRLVKYLFHKHKDLNSNPQNLHKKQGMAV